jgi:hypothetical protein
VLLARHLARDPHQFIGMVTRLVAPHKWAVPDLRQIASISTERRDAYLSSSEHTH